MDIKNTDMDIILNGFNTLNPNGFCQALNVAEFAAIYDQTLDVIDDCGKNANARAYINLERMLLVLMEENAETGRQQQGDHDLNIST